MREMLLSICIVVIATALFKIISPENSFKKQISLLVSCFFLVSVLTVVTKRGWSFDIDAFNQDSAVYIDFTGKVNMETQKQVARNLSTHLKEILDKEDIHPKQILIIINISNLYSISINEVKLVFPQDSQKVERAVEIVQGAVGDEITVSFERTE